MLTTASITFSAISAMPSGPRANAGAVANTLAAPIVIAAPRRRRRRLRAGLAPVISAYLQGKSGREYRATLRPNGAAAQACDRDISAKNRPPAAHDCVDDFHESFRDGAPAPDLRGAIAPRGISRFRVRCGACHRRARGRTRWQ